MKKTALFIMFIIFSLKGFSQSTNILPDRIEMPRLSTQQIMAISNPQNGTMIYDTDINCIKIFNGSTWNCLISTSANYQNEPNGICSGTYIAMGSGFNTGAYADMAKCITINNDVYVVGGITGTGVVSFIGGNNISSGTFLIKYNSQGLLQWFKPYTNGSITTLTSGNGYIFVGGTKNNKAIIEKIDPTNGNTVWSQIHGNNIAYAKDLAFEGNFVYVTGFCFGGIGSLNLNGGYVLRLNENDGTIANVVIASTLNNISITTLNGSPIVIGNYLNAGSISNGTNTVSYPAAVGQAQFLWIIDSNFNQFSFTKYEGDDANDALVPVGAYIEKTFLNGIFINQLKICGNTLGSFTLNGQQINGTSGYLQTINLSATTPSVINILTIKNSKFMGLCEGYAVGRIYQNLTINNSYIIPGHPSFGIQGFLMSIKKDGTFNWVVKSSSNYNSSNIPKIVTKTCDDVISFGNYTGNVELCSNTLTANNLNHINTFWWKFTKNQTTCN